MRKTRKQSEHDAPLMLSVYADKLCIGHILARPRAGFDAFDREDRPLGVFSTQQLAADAVSAAAPSPETE
jgi:hypothetical protein